MKMTLTKQLLLAILILSAAGCSMADKPDITDSQFVMLYVDLSFTAEQFLSDSVMLAQIQDSVFKAHEISREQFDNYKATLDSSPERWSEIWQMVINEINKREEAIKKENKPSESETNKKEPKD